MRVEAMSMLSSHVSWISRIEYLLIWNQFYCVEWGSWGGIASGCERWEFGLFLKGCTWVLYPHHWLQPHVDKLFEEKFSMLKNPYCNDLLQMWCKLTPTLDFFLHSNHQCSQFKCVMKSNSSDDLKNPSWCWIYWQSFITLWPCPWSWETTSWSGLRWLNYVEDENTFLTMAFAKSKLCNCLSKHMLVCVGIYSQKYDRSRICHLIRCTMIGMQIGGGN